MILLIWLLIVKNSTIYNAPQGAQRVRARTAPSRHGGRLWCTDAPWRPFLRLCCMEISKRALALARVYSRNAETNGLPKIAHALERFGRNCNLGRAAAATSS